MATTTFYNDDHETGMLRSVSSTYSTARSGGGTTTVLTIDNNALYGAWVGQSKPGDYQIDNPYLVFDTSAIGTDEISAAYFRFYFYSDNSTTDFTIQVRACAWGTTLTESDWVPGADAANHPLLATYATSGYASGYQNLTSEAALLTAINKTGNTYVYVSSSRYAAGNAPSGDEYVKFYVDTYGGNDYRTELVVTHAPAAATVYRGHLACHHFVPPILGGH